MLTIIAAGQDRTGKPWSGRVRFSLPLCFVLAERGVYIRAIPATSKRVRARLHTRIVIQCLNRCYGAALVPAFTTIISHGRRDGKPQRQLRRNLAEEAASFPPESYPREAAHQSSGCSGSPQRRFIGFRSSSEAGRLNNNIHWPRSRQGRDTNMETTADTQDRRNSRRLSKLKRNDN